MKWSRWVRSVAIELVRLCPGGDRGEVIGHHLFQGVGFLDCRLGRDLAARHDEVAHALPVNIRRQGQPTRFEETKGFFHAG